MVRFSTIDGPPNLAALFFGGLTACLLLKPPIRDAVKANSGV
jgi:hypothetical protein